jgi:peptidoglycan/xylan/chitin deacetylase (PgdA/CDA1 family)
MGPYIKPGKKSMKKILYPIIKKILLNTGIFHTILKIKIRWTKGVTILMLHHGYENNCLTIPKMSISYQNFNLLYKFLNKYFNIITPTTYEEHLLKGSTLPTNSLLITIDDCYRNIEPILDIIYKNGDSAIIFPVTSHVNTNKVFWWDLTYQALADKEPKEVETTMHSMQCMTPDERSKILSKIKIDDTSLDKTYIHSLNWEELRKWNQKGFEIGSHTDSHIFMHQHSLDEINREIKLSIAKLKSNLEITPKWFAFPAGYNFTNSSSVLKKYNFIGAFSTVPGISSNQQYFLKRINISDDIISSNLNNKFNLAETMWGFILTK